MNKASACPGLTATPTRPILLATVACGHGVARSAVAFVGHGMDGVRLFVDLAVLRRCDRRQLPERCGLSAAAREKPGLSGFVLPSMRPPGARDGQHSNSELAPPAGALSRLRRKDFTAIFFCRANGGDA